MAALGGEPGLAVVTGGGAGEAVALACEVLDAVGFGVLAKGVGMLLEGSAGIVVEAVGGGGESVDVAVDTAPAASASSNVGIA